MCWLKKFRLCARSGFGVDEEVAEDVIEAGEDDAVACEFGVLGAGDGCGEEGVDVGLVHVHQAVEFALGQAAYADAFGNFWLTITALAAV